MKCLLWIGRHPKRVIYILYFILFFYGLILLAKGLYDEATIEDKYDVTADIWVGVGVLSSVNAVMGLFGTANNDKCLVYMSIILLFTSCVAQILLIVIRITMPPKESEEQQQELQQQFDKPDNKKEMEKFHEMEIALKCCGVNGYDDYETKFDPLLLGYPPSCCGLKTKKCLDPYKVGCHQVRMENQHRDELIRAFIFLFSSFVKFISAIIIAILTIWGDDLLTEEIHSYY